MGMRKGLRQVTAFGNLRIPFLYTGLHDKQIVSCFPKTLFLETAILAMFIVKLLGMGIVKIRQLEAYFC